MQYCKHHRNEPAKYIRLIPSYRALHPAHTAWLVCEADHIQLMKTKAMKPERLGEQQLMMAA